MPAQYVSADALRRQGGVVNCSNCGNSAKDAPPNERWTIWNGNQLFCLKCAKQHGVDQEQ
jgi:hypothetical protein